MKSCLNKIIVALFFISWFSLAAHAHENPLSGISEDHGTCQVCTYISQLRNVLPTNYHNTFAIHQNQETPIALQEHPFRLQTFNPENPRAPPIA